VPWHALIREREKKGESMLDEVDRSTRRGVAAILAISIVAVLALSSTPVLSGTAENAGPLKYVKAANTTFNGGASSWTNGAVCPQGWNVVGGGVNVDNALFRMAESYATTGNGFNPGRRGWTVNLTNTAPGQAHAQAFAICAKATNLTGNWP
jgi:hypothetical protein